VSAGAKEVPVVRVISRLNVGGPAIQAIILTKLLERRGYRTTLLRGVEAAREGSMDGLAARIGVRPLRVRALRREPGLHDLFALLSLVRIMARVRPVIVHTHAAKGGTLGRAAALALGRRRPPVLIHTFHGHVLTGYFSPRTARFYTSVERWLARRTSRLVAVSEEVRLDLVRLGVAPPDQIEVIKLGFDLSGFLAPDDERRRRRTAFRRELGLPHDARVVTLVARLVPIKRVDRFLRVALRVSEHTDAWFLVVGDGELADRLRASQEARHLADRLVWGGLRHDMPAVMFASDLVVQTSDNEGTPVSLIEAHAAGLPVVATDVGGVSSVVRNGMSGRLVAADDEAGFASAVSEALASAAAAKKHGEAGRRHVFEHFGVERLVADVDKLYRELLKEVRK
jgi:glycosyltransferase involved in cell wall biosynthesis